MTAHVITANDLKDGLVVYQTADGGWTGVVHEAEVVDDGRLDSALARGRQAEAENVVVGVYAVGVDAADGSVTPTRYRERLRAFGPSTHPQFARITPSA